VSDCCLAQNEQYEELDISKNSGKPTDTCFIQKIYAPSSSLLQGKHQPFTPSPRVYGHIFLALKTSMSISSDSEKIFEII
jgi:hypothetical protein